MTGAVESTIAGPELVFSTTDTPSTTAPPPASATPTPALTQQPKPSSYPQARIPLVDNHIDEPRAVRVAVIGWRWAFGTWFVNVYQSTFEPNTQWSDGVSYGAEIRDYWQSVARKHNVYDLVKLQHHVQDLLWDENASV
ncbi:hypothetical protein Cpir12675_006797 [Ceratocystis pirilliformis]|uniref:Uncharacterized protein n=1 Tax=Ceratocystis pirilliformis TaxID=259994 RepID=A0ABR3YGU1_9PEZI